MVDHKNGQALVIALVVMALLVAAAWFLIANSQQQQAPISVHTFEIRPSEFKSTEGAELHLKVENLVTDTPTNVAVYFETHENVKIYRGDAILPKSGGNYSYAKSLEPKEVSDLTFTIKGAVDVGDTSRNYYIKAYIYVNGEFFTIKDIDFLVRRG